MDGAFVAYHNTVKTFGFEYVSLDTIEKTLFGSNEKADFTFQVSSQMLVSVLEKVKQFLSDKEFEFVKIGY